MGVKARLDASLGVALACVALAAGAQAPTEVPRRIDATQAAAAIVSGGWVLLMRHAATEPGVGDPPDMRLGDCATQRQLSDAGRAQARRIGRRLRDAGIAPGEVLASQWCRTAETAELAFGAYRPWPALNSFFGERSREAAQTAAVLERVRALGADANLTLVTHQVNITALTGVFPAPAELVAARWREGRLQPVYRIPDE